MRKATLTDLPQLLEIGIKFHRVSGWQDYIDLDLESLAEAIQTSINDGGVFIHEYGAIAGFITPIWFNKKYNMIQELFWWAEKDGLKLLERFEQWAQTTDAKIIGVASMKSLEMERVNKIYKRRGYKELEGFHIKELK